MCIRDSPHTICNWGHTLRNNSQTSNFIEANKVASILFVDMVASTELLALNEPQLAREFITCFISTIEKVSGEFGGEVIKTEGDGVKIGFGTNNAMEDHASRAVYAALKMIRECHIVINNQFADVNYKGLRAGIHSGYVITKKEKNEDSKSEDTFGLTTHIAAKLQDSAQVDHVCLSGATQMLISGDLAAKRYKLISIGNAVSPVPSFTLDGNDQIDFKFMGQSHNALTQIIGRKAELSEIEQILDFENTSGQISLLICGEAGLGKSRMIEDVSFNLRAHSIKQILIKGLSVMEKTPFFAIQQILKSISFDDNRLNSSEEEALKMLKSMDLIAMENWRLGEIEKVNSISRGTLKIVEAVLASGPLVIIAEDLHFLDEESLRFFDKILKFAKNSKYLRIIATTRLPVPVSLKKSFDSYQQLHPLTTKQTADLIRTLSKNLSPIENPKAVNDIITKSGGNPLAITELTKLEFDDSQENQKPNVPVSIEPVLRKRIEYLSQDSRVLINYLSLLGSPLTLEKAWKLTEWNEERLLKTISETIQTGIVERNFAGDLEFGHDLYRIVCAENLTAAQKKSFHTKIYNHLNVEAKSSETVPDIQMLARHAFGSGHIDEGLEHFKKALSVANNIGAIRTVRNLFIQVCDYCDLCKNSAYHKARFAMLSFDATQRLADEGNLLEIYLEALNNYKELFSFAEIIVLKSQLSIIYWTMGEAPKGLTYAIEAASEATSADHLGLESITIYSLACLEFASGFLESSVNRIEKHIKKIPRELAQKKWGQSVSYPSIVLQTFGAWFAIDMGKYPTAIQFTDAAIKTEKEFPNTYGHVLCKLAEGYLHFRQNCPEKGAPILLEAYEIAEKSALSLAPMSAAWAVLCLLKIDDTETAQVLLDREFNTGRYDIMRNANRGYFFLAKAKLLSSMKQYNEAERWIKKAIKDTSAKGDLITLAYCYAAYPEILPPNNQIGPEGIRNLTKAMDIAKECGMKYLVRECEEKLFIES